MSRPKLECSTSELLEWPLAVGWAASRADVSSLLLSTASHHCDDQLAMVGMAVESADADIQGQGWPASWVDVYGGWQDVNCCCVYHRCVAWLRPGEPFLAISAQYRSSRRALQGGDGSLAMCNLHVSSISAPRPLPRSAALWIQVQINCG